MNLQFLKGNRRIHGTQHTLPKAPPSVDGGNWFEAGLNQLAMQG